MGCTTFKKRKVKLRMGKQRWISFKYIFRWKNYTQIERNTTLFIRLYVYSNNNIESKNIAKEVVKPLENYIEKIKYIANKPYWKIDGMYVVEIKIKLYDKLNQDYFNKFLKEISNDWSILGINEDELIASDTNCMELEMVYICIDDKTEIKFD